MTCISGLFVASRTLPEQDNETSHKVHLPGSTVVESLRVNSYTTQTNDIIH